MNKLNDPIPYEITPTGHAELLAAKSPADLFAAIKYQLNAPPVTTMGDCVMGCGEWARGGAVCAFCLAVELDRRLARVLHWDAVDGWVVSFLRARAREAEIEDAITELTRRAAL